MPPRSTNRRNAPQSPPKAIAQPAKQTRRSARSQSHEPANDTITVETATRGNKHGLQPDKSGKLTYPPHRRGPQPHIPQLTLIPSSRRHRRISHPAKHTRTRCRLCGRRVRRRTNKLHAIPARDQIQPRRDDRSAGRPPR